jgi:NADH:ubiquinone oxidoreductase subunit 5 (subunit L)/multisubunit Na+/H+ antiporter MnhA subunit
VNKIGDISLIIGMSLIFLTFKTLDFSSIFILYPFFLKKIYFVLGYKFNLLNTIGLLLLIASMAKSAQIGLHT